MKNIVKIIFGLIFTFSSYWVYGAEYKINDIKIIGAKRINHDAIKSYIVQAKKNIITSEEINNSLQNLYENGYFKDVKINVHHNTLQIFIQENPTVARINFEGNKELDDEVLKLEIDILPRRALSISDVRKAIEKIKRIYRYKGYFLAKVEPKIIKRDENRVDLVFEIQEGKKTKIGKIIFLGNESFSDSDLASVIHTKESRWYRFFSSADNYDPDRLAYDKELLRLFYLNHGYADCNMKSAVAELTTDKGEFYITFNIEEGQIYKIGKCEISSQIKDVSQNEILNILQIKQDDLYSNARVEESINAIAKLLGEKGYAFVDVKPMIDKDTKNRIINFIFELKEGPKVYIDRITINGNTKTNEEVIRRELLFYEGDSFDSRKMSLSEKKLRDLGFFKQVKIEKFSSNYPDKININIRVAEEGTAEISGSGGYSTEAGLLLGGKFTERNFMGKGQNLNLEFNWSKYSREFDIGFLEPYFMDKDIFAGINIYNSSYKGMQNYNYKENIKGFTLTTGYLLSTCVSQTWNYTLKENKVNIGGKKIAPIVSKQAGRTITSAVGLTTTYDRRNSRISPTKGWIVGFSQNFAGLGGDNKYLKNSLFGTHYHTFYKNYILSINGSFSYMSGLGQKVRMSDRYSLGGENLRGFEPGGIGPRTKINLNSLGGLINYKISSELLLPVGIPKEFGVKGALFCDAGNLWHSGESTKSIVKNQDNIRISVGLGIRWRSPFGPLKIDFAKAIKKSKYDKTQNFHFGVSTRY